MIKYFLIFSLGLFLICCKSTSDKLNDLYIGSNKEFLLHNLGNPNKVFTDSSKGEIMFYVKHIKTEKVITTAVLYEEKLITPSETIRTITTEFPNGEKRNIPSKITTTTKTTTKTKTTTTTTTKNKIEYFDEEKPTSSPVTTTTTTTTTTTVPKIEYRNGVKYSIPSVTTTKNKIEFLDEKKPSFPSETTIPVKDYWNYKIFHFDLQGVIYKVDYINHQFTPEVIYLSFVP